MAFMSSARVKMSLLPLADSGANGSCQVKRHFFFSVPLVLQDFVIRSCSGGCLPVGVHSDKTFAPSRRLSLRRYSTNLEDTQYANDWVPPSDSLSRLWRRQFYSPLFFGHSVNRVRSFILPESPLPCRFLSGSKDMRMEMIKRASRRGPRLESDWSLRCGTWCVARKGGAHTRFLH